MFLDDSNSDIVSVNETWINEKNRTIITNDLLSDDKYTINTNDILSARDRVKEVEEL